MTVRTAVIEAPAGTRWVAADSEKSAALAQKGMKKGDLSKFIEEAVRWRVFDQTVDT
jgi:hypothetical protein